MREEKGSSSFGLSAGCTVLYSKSRTYVVFLEACVWKLRLGAVLAAVRLFHRARQHERQRDEDAA